MNQVTKSKLFRECLCDMKQILDENKQEFFLAYGTLLGCVRNNDFISYDTDIDIAIFYDKFDKNIINKIKESKNFIYRKTWGDIENSAEIQFKHRNHVNIDIFLMYKMKENYYYSASFCYDCDLKKEGYCKWGHTIKDLISITFKNNKFLIPSNYKEYLEERYGKDWMVPKRFLYFQGLRGGYKNLIN